MADLQQKITFNGLVETPSSQYGMVLFNVILPDLGIGALNQHYTQEHITIRHRSERFEKHSSVR